MASIDPVLHLTHAWQGGRIERSPVPTLYQSEGSYHSMIARLCLVEKSVSWKARLMDLHTLSEQVQPWFLLLNPEGTVPVLVRTPDGAEQDEVVAGTLTILRWVDAYLPTGPSLTPGANTPAMQRMEALLQLHAAFSAEDCSVAFGDLITREHIAPARCRHAQRFLAKSVANPVMHPAVRAAAAAKVEALEARCARWADVDALRRDVRASALALLDALEEGLSGVGSGPFAVGAQYTLADVALTVFLAHVGRYPALAGELAARPNAQRYWLLLRSRPSFAKADVWTGARPGKAVENVLGAVAAPFRAAGGVLHERVLNPIATTAVFAAVATCAIDAHNHVAVTLREEVLPALAAGASATGRTLHKHVVAPMHAAGMTAGLATHEHVVKPSVNAALITGKACTSFVVKTACDTGNAVVDCAKACGAFIDHSYHHTTNAVDEKMAPLVNGMLETMVVRVA